MARTNNLSHNLRAFQQARNSTLTEFSRALSVPKSTLQSVMLDGNTTLDTLIHMAEALDVTLDQLVFGADVDEQCSLTHWLLTGASWYEKQPAARQEKLHYHIDAILDLLENED